MSNTSSAAKLFGHDKHNGTKKTFVVRKPPRTEQPSRSVIKKKPMTREVIVYC